MNAIFSVKIVLLSTALCFSATKAELSIPSKKDNLEKFPEVLDLCGFVKKSADKLMKLHIFLEKQKNAGASGEGINQEEIQKRTLEKLQKIEELLKQAAKEAKFPG